MTHKMLGFYLQGLVIASVVAIIYNATWLLYQILQKKHWKALDRKQMIYEFLLICLLTTPVLAFGIMALLIIQKV